MGQGCAAPKANPHEAEAHSHLDQHFEESLATKQLAAVLKQAFQDIYKAQPNYPCVLNLGMIMLQCKREERYTQPVSSGTKFTDMAVLMKAARFLKYAMAAYSTTEEDIKQIVMGDEDSLGGNFEILHAQLSDSQPAACPRFFIAADKASNDIVLSISGGPSMESAIHQATADTTPFLSGVANSRILDAATKVIAAAKEPLENALKDSPKSSLALVGHSTGAGAAILATLQGFGEDSVVAGMLAKGKVKCYAFGSPPVFEPTEKALPANLVSAVTCFVNCMDCIPRTCRRTIGKLLMAVKEVDEMDMSAIDRLQYMKDGTSPNDNNDNQTFPDYKEVPEELQAELPCLSLPGTTLLLFKGDDEKMACKKLKKDAIDGVLISEDMFKHNAPSAYDESLTETLMQLHRNKGCC